MIDWPSKTSKKPCRGAPLKHLRPGVQVIGSDFESQKNIHKFLKYRPLRKVIQTLTNDPRNDFDFWAQNPQVIAMLEVMIAASLCTTAASLCARMQGGIEALFPSKSRFRYHWRCHNAPQQ